MKFDVDDKNRCRLVCVKFHLNRCRFAAAVAKCLGGSLFWGQCSNVVNLHPLTPHIIRQVIPQNGERIVTTDSVTSFQ